METSTRMQIKVLVIIVQAALFALVLAACDDAKKPSQRAPKPATNRPVEAPTSAPIAENLAAPASAAAASEPSALTTAAPPATQPAAAAPSAEDIVKGEFLFRRKKCNQCHKAGPIPGMGPSLAGASKRISHDDMKTWVVDPHKLKPKTLMPAWEGTDAELEQILAYVRSL